MDYATLSLAEVSTGLDAVAREAQETFGALTPPQLNWRPDATRWSVAQCFDHLVTANRLMLQAADEATNGAMPRTIWQRAPVLPRLFGRLMVRSQAPTASGRFTAPAKARPSSSDIATDVIPRFVEQHQVILARLRALDESTAAQTIMTSPFVRFITYSVLDGSRLMFAHDRRHFEQARRVTQSTAFPGF